MNVLLIEAIDICIDSLHNNNDDPPPKKKNLDDFRNVLNIATKKSFFIFYSDLYKHVIVMYWVYTGSRFSKTFNVWRQK